jgi:hypothetical protein
MISSGLITRLTHSVYFSFTVRLSQDELTALSALSLTIGLVTITGKYQCVHESCTVQLLVTQ